MLTFLGIAVIVFVVYAAIKIAKYNREYDRVCTWMKLIWSSIVDDLEQILAVYEFYMIHRKSIAFDLDNSVYEAMQKMRRAFELLKSAEQYIEENYSEFEANLYYMIQAAESYCNEITRIKEQLMQNGQKRSDAI